MLEGYRREGRNREEVEVGQVVEGEGGSFGRWVGRREGRNPLVERPASLYGSVCAVYKCDEEDII